jgi:prophage regulatory protein
MAKRAVRIDAAATAIAGDRFLRVADVERRTGLTRAVIYYFVTEGTFPRQIKLGKRVVAWRESEVENWMRERIAGVEAA